MKRRGLTLIETLVALALSLFIFIAAFEFMGITKNLFGKVRDAETEAQSAEVALDKIRIDLLSAGRGLVGPMRNLAAVGIELTGQQITVALAEREYDLSQDLLPGQTRVPLASASGLGVRREICLVENGWSELHSIAAVESAAVVLGEPLQAAFSKAGGRLQLIEKIAYYLDEPPGVLRRKVNSSSAQPLLEDVAAFDFGYDEAANLARAGFSLQNAKEKEYEVSVFPKNIGLACRGR